METILTRNHAELTLEVDAHIAADVVVQGEYWENGKGCFIGCLTHSDDPAPAYERFGLPEPLLRIAESIFERLPADEAKAFFAATPAAVGRDGKDLNRVHWQFLAAELRALPAQSDDVQAVIDPVIAGMELLAAGKEWPADVAYAAADAAYAAADRHGEACAHACAAYAARSAAYAADAAYVAADAARAASYSAAAADAGDAAAYSAWAAADAARAAYATAGPHAAAAARATATQRQRDTLLRVIAEAV